MALIRFEGTVKSKRFDKYENCYVTIDITECYEELYLESVEKVGEHTPRTNEFKIVNERPLCCVNRIDLAISSVPGDVVEIEAYELFDMKGNPVNRYQVVNYRHISHYYDLKHFLQREGECYDR